MNYLGFQRLSAAFRCYAVLGSSDGALQVKKSVTANHYSLRSFANIWLASIHLARQCIQHCLELTGERMSSIFALSKLNPLNYQRNVREAEIRRFAAQCLRLACFLLIVTMPPLLRAQEDGPVHVLPPSRVLPTTDPVEPIDVRSRVFVSAPEASGSEIHNMVYAALKRSGEFQLVNDPAQADQIFDIHIVDSDSTYHAPDQLPPDYSVILNILNKKGSFVRGPYTVKVKSARLERNVEKNLRQAIDTLVRRVLPKEIPVGTKLATKGDERTLPPAPAPFSHVKTVFISSIVQDKTSAMSANAPSDFYKQFYAAMQKWGRYKLLPSEEGADLLIHMAVSMPPGQDFEDPGFDPRVEVRITMVASNLVYGYNMPLRWRMMGGRRGFRILASKTALQKSAEALVDELRRLTTSADAADASPKVNVQ